jgi:hypothetical protein
LRTIGGDSCFDGIGFVADIGGVNLNGRVAGFRWS